MRVGWAMYTFKKIFVQIHLAIKRKKSNKTYEMLNSTFLNRIKIH